MEEAKAEMELNMKKEIKCLLELYLSQRNQNQLHNEQDFDQTINSQLCPSRLLDQEACYGSNGSTLHQEEYAS